MAPHPSNSVGQQLSDLTILLEEMVAPRLFTRKQGSDTLRIWVPGCGSGEVAYAVAGVFYECAQQHNDPPTIQIFATDNDAASIMVARRGLYHEEHLASLRGLHLQHFFHRHHSYQIKPEVRALITFAQHFMLRDPPFADLDVIVSSELHFPDEDREQILHDFHWCLRPRGYLILSCVQSRLCLEYFFVPDERSSQIFHRRDALITTPPLLHYPLHQDKRTAAESVETLSKQLVTMNRALRRKVAELTQVNNDLTNLMGATDLAILFLDHLLQITRSTAQARRLFNIIASDHGRPLGHIRHTLRYSGLLDDATSVMSNGLFLEREVQSTEGHWYLVRLRPYRVNDEQIVGVVLICVDITARRRAEEALRAARDELEQRVMERTEELSTANLQLQVEMTERVRLGQERTELLRKLVTTLEDERRRIARELHDQLGQSISALNVGLSTLAASELDDEQRMKTLARLKQITAQIDHDMDRLALDLRPMALDDLGLSEAVRQHIEQWAEQTDINVEFELIDQETGRLPAEVESVVFRVIQEALTNVVKHAEARTVSVILELRREQVRVIVEDDGRGFDLEGLQQQANNRRLGLLGMRERLGLVGGTLTFETVPGTGTTLFAQIPIFPSPQRERQGSARSHVPLPER